MRLKTVFFLKEGNQNNNADKLNNIIKTEGEPDAIFLAIKFTRPVHNINTQKKVDTNA